MYSTLPGCPSHHPNLPCATQPPPSYLLLRHASVHQTPPKVANTLGPSKYCIYLNFQSSSNDPPFIKLDNRNRNSTSCYRIASYPI